MKKFFLPSIIALALGFNPAFAAQLTNDQVSANGWNLCFSNLNPQIPYDKKAEPVGQQNYLRLLIKNQEAKGVEFYKSPDKYGCASVAPAVVTPVIPAGPISQQPATAAYSLSAILSAAKAATAAALATERQVEAQIAGSQ